MPVSDPELEALLEAEEDEVPWAFCSVERRPYHGRNQVWSPLKLRAGLRVVIHLFNRVHVVTVADIDGYYICFEEWKNWKGKPDWYHLGDLGAVRMPCNGLWHRWHYISFPESDSVGN